MPWIGEVIDPFVMGFYAKESGVTARTMGMFTVSTAIESFALPRVMASIVAHVRRQGGAGGTEVRNRLALLAALYALAQYAYAMYDDARNQMEPLLQAYIMDELVGRVMQRYAATFSSVNTALVYSKINLVHGYLRNIMFKVFTSGLPEMITMLGLGVSFAQSDMGLGATVFGMLVIHFAAIVGETERCKTETIAHAKFESVVTDHLHDRLSNLDTIVTAAHGRGVEHERAAIGAMSEYRTLLHRTESNCMSRQRVQAYGASAVIMLVAITYSYHLYLGRGKPGGLDDESFCTVLFTLNVLFNHVYYLTHTIPGLVADVRNLNVHAEFLRTLMQPPTHTQSASHAHAGDDLEVGARAPSGCVRFEAATFSYDENENGNGSENTNTNTNTKMNYVVRGLNMWLPRGILVALVGPSGSGKTTFVRMVLGQIRPTGGRVHLDGLDMSDVPMGTIAYIGQNTTRLFHASVRYNIEYGHTPASLRKVYAQYGTTLAKFVAAMGLQHVLPIDLDSDAGPLGELLSGGQRQAVHLLRCVLNDRAQIVILDEPTSALDSATTGAVCRLMSRLAAQGRTVLVVTHDPSVEAVCQATVRFSGNHTNPVLHFFPDAKIQPVEYVASAGEVGAPFV